MKTLILIALATTSIQGVGVAEKSVKQLTPSEVKQEAKREAVRRQDTVKETKYWDKQRIKQSKSKKKLVKAYKVGKIDAPDFNVELGE